MSSKFKEGDRVRAIAACDGENGLIGKTGVVVSIEGVGTHPVGVRFDEKFARGHTLNRKCEDGFGRWCEESSLELLDDELKVGDRVEYTETTYPYLTGRRGTIKAINNEYYTNYAVEFDEHFDGGHTCDGRCKIGHGFYVYKKEFKKLPPEDKQETPKQRPATITVAGLDRKYKYIARDKDGSLFAYVEKPVVDVGGVQWYGTQYKALDGKLFKEIKWGDEPVEINQGD